MILAAICKTDPLNTPTRLQTEAGRLHQQGAMLDQVPFAAVLITIALYREKELKINSLCLLLMLLLVWFGFVLFVGSIKAQFPADGRFGPKVLVGWQNRIMIITQAMWLIYIPSLVRKKIADLAVHPKKLEYSL